MLSWKKHPRGSYIAEIGDLRVVVKEYNEYWWLSMGIRSYSSDMSVGMFRPAVNIIQFPKPCTEEQALELANDYMEKIHRSYCIRCIRQLKFVEIFLRSQSGISTIIVHMLHKNVVDHPYGQ